MKSNPATRIGGFRRGFTLVELLVIIVIIAALSAVALQGLARYRDSAYSTHSLGNLRQFQTANMTFASENHGQFIPIQGADSAGNLIYWHDNSDFLVALKGAGATFNPDGSVNTTPPPGLLDPIVVRAKRSGSDSLPTSYGYNDTDLPVDGLRLQQMNDPARTAAFITATDARAQYNGRFLWENSPVEGRSNNGKIAFRHGERALVVYYDGRAGALTPADFRSFDSNGGSSHPFWRATPLPTS